MELQREIDRLGPWFHNLHLPDGDGGMVQTRPDHPFGDFPRFKWDQLADHLPADLGGVAALDIGCNAGFYAMELARRGADVVGIDLNLGYLAQAEFAVKTSGLTERVRLRKQQVYELAGEAGQYDLVLFMGVFYHLRYPLLGLDVVAKTLRPGGTLVFQTLTTPDEQRAKGTHGLNFADRNRLDEAGWPKLSFFEHGFNEDPTNWWAANAAGVEAMLRSAGLKIIAEPGHEIYLCQPDPDAHIGVPELRDAEYHAALNGMKPK
jgi:tRNA (mo5U34)-methyltransferase